MRLDVLIVGAGKAGRELRAAYFHHLPETRVAAFCDPDLDAASRAAAEFGCDGAEASLEEALERHRPDIVSICSPPRFHLDQATLALAAGAHVLLEKPMVLEGGEIDRLEECWRRAGTKLTVAHNQAFDAGNQAAFRQVAAGRIGRVLNVDRVWLRDPDADRMMADSGYWAHGLAGGRWGETLPHDLYIAYRLLGPMSVVSVSGCNTHRRWPWLPADEVKVVLTNGEAFCGLRYSMAVEDGLLRPMLVAGSRGALLVHESSVSRLGPLPVDRPLGDVARGLAGAARRVAGGVRRAGGRAWRSLGLPRASRGRPRTGQFRLVEAFVNHVAHDAPPPVTWEEASTTMALTLEIGARLEAGRAPAETVAPEAR